MSTTTDPLTEWRRANAEEPAQAAYRAVPESRRLWCRECDYTGVDETFREKCQFCDGLGFRDEPLSDERRRKLLDHELRKRGLDPAAFDDHGRLIPATVEAES